MANDINNVLNDDSKLVLTVEQISKILQIGKSTAYELVNRKDCPFTVHRFGKTTIRVDKKSFLESLKTPITM